MEVLFMNKEEYAKLVKKYTPSEEKYPTSFAKSSLVKNGCSFIAIIIAI